MDTEKIKVRVTQSGQTMDVVVFSKRGDHIQVVIGEGIHSVKCELTPTRNGLAYAGSVMTRAADSPFLGKTVDLTMTCVLFAQRDGDYFAPRLRAAFPMLNVLTAMDLPEADDRIAEAEVIVANGHTFNDARLGKAGKLKWIQAMTTGTDAILGSRALRPEVVVTTMRGIHGPQMSEMAFMYMLNLARNYPRMLDNQRRHVWKRWTQTRLCGKTVTIVGVGVDAESLAPRCKAFGMTVVGVTRTPRAVEGFDRLFDYAHLEQAAAAADFLAVLAPYSEENDSLINA